MHSKTMTALILKANRSPQMPEFAETDEKELQRMRWWWTKQHYFDNIDLTDPRMLHTPFLFQRVDYFYRKIDGANIRIVSHNQ